MILKDWLKQIDPIVDVKIWGVDDEPLFEGSALDISWTLVDYPIGRIEDNGEEPIYFSTYQNKYGTTLPIIIINIINN